MVVLVLLKKKGYHISSDPEARGRNVITLLLIVAVVFGLDALYGVAGAPERNYRGSASSLAFCLLAIALAFWHQGR